MPSNEIPRTTEYSFTRQRNCEDRRGSALGPGLVVRIADVPPRVRVSPVEILRMFKLAKASAVKARTQTINQLKAVLVAADPTLRKTLSGLNNLLPVRRCTQREIDTPCDTTSAAAYTLRLLARRILTLIDEIRDLEQQITAAVPTTLPSC